MRAGAPQAVAGQVEQDRRAALRLVSVSRETEARLAIYVELLARWRTTTNLISESTFASVWTRHIADSAQLLPLGEGARRWVDIGSGAGFPGLVIAIMLADEAGALVHCIESDRRKCAFLREVVRATGAKAVVHPARVEALDAKSLGPVDAVTARAFAPLPAALESARFWLNHGAIGIFPRGRSAEGQIGALSDHRDYAIQIFPSVVDARSAILRVRTRQT